MTNRSAILSVQCQKQRCIQKRSLEVYPANVKCAGKMCEKVAHLKVCYMDWVNHIIHKHSRIYLRTYWESFETHIRKTRWAGTSKIRRTMDAAMMSQNSPRRCSYADSPRAMTARDTTTPSQDHSPQKNVQMTEIDTNCRRRMQSMYSTATPARSSRSARRT